MSFSDWLSHPLSYLFGEGSAVSQGEQLDQNLATLNATTYAPGGSVYNAAQDQFGTDYANSLLGTVQAQDAAGSTANDIATGDLIAANTSTPAGWSNVLKDFLWLAAAAAAVWLFLELGGAKKVKEWVG